MLKSKLLKKILLITAVLAIFGITSGFAAEGGAKIDVVEDVADFGDVKPKSVHTFTYRFKNVGTERLDISRIQSTCGCSVPQLDKKEYAPNETGEIKVVYTSPTREGHTTKHLYIHSNDVSNPRYPLQIKSNTVLKANVEPSSLDLVLADDNAGFGELKIYSRDGKEFAIRGISTAGNPFRFDIDRQHKATIHTIKPTVDIEKLKENLTGIIRISIDHPECDTLTVTYNTLPQYSASPARIIVQNAVAGETQQRDIWIKNNYGKTVEITGVKSEKGFVGCEILENSDGMARIRAEITAPKSSGQTRYFSDDLVVNIEDGEDIIIKISGWYAR